MTDISVTSDRCPGCGVALPPIDGPTHAYMTSSPACYALFTQVLAVEYSDPTLLPTHRLTVDTYAVQHPGAQTSRREIQSVGLQHARLYLQLANTLPPKKANDVMLGMSVHKASLRPLTRPETYSLTIADVAPFAGTALHAEKTRQWAQTTWDAYAPHNTYIRDWVAQHSA